MDFVSNLCVIYFLIQVNQIFAQCPQGMFGANCKDMCHCDDYSCNTEGECNTCNFLTFSYKCQYFNRFYEAKTDIANIDITDILSDGNDSTCTSLTGENIIIDLSGRFSVTWLRFVTSKPDDLQYGFNITFQDDKSQSVNLSGNETLIVVDKTIDVHFQLNSEFIQYIILGGKVVQEMCTLFISSGQLVSLGKTAYYSTPSTDTFKILFPEALDFEEFTSEKYNVDGGTLWEIDLESSYIVQNFQIYFDDAVFSRAVIEASDSGGTLIYTRIVEYYQKRYILFYSSVTTPVRYINFIAEDANNSSLTILLHELKAFGECPEGSWGVQCRENCSSDCPESCRFDDGLCTKYCLGYSDPPKCQTVCNIGTWGVNCSNPCSNRCLNQTCDRITGKCNKGCLGYKDTPDCTIECDTGSWGINCASNCSKCFNSTCNSLTGLCDQGCLGYRDPPDCSIECDTGTWGVNCSSQCSDKCFNKSCDSITSKCAHGCLGFSDPPDCTTKCDTGSWGINCVSNCSKCFNSTCNSQTGLCDHGCLGYRDPPDCAIECDTGTWGRNCGTNCSKCYNSICNSKTGLCDQGCLGYSDPQSCELDCDTGTWGRNCASNCSRCFNSTCNSTTGLCDQGCLGYSDPPTCMTECGSGYWGLNCTYRCSDKCIHKSCDRKSGVCDNDDGLNLSNDSQSLSSEATIAIAVSLSLFGLIVVIVVFVVLKNKGVACFGTAAAVVPQN
ncbi:multiple epidermal growth factor-like domains protein 10 isoform X2 [Biomphalaria glabrata]|uniref:Multiple epidermal growth factor-like domains protein 10 isoform X2 n=1 Tax=Biomphalaria glabrata TaxID=6526 RepID=A0A9W3ACP0_BIOGL|nr:multiple epidermal growth factor-like domains protein 10 isoform X2 [Biomphalaria glabrata]XP_055885055.1 multiple epidermal growth factor-like domains protein 10 isoform X2 [Biomphalaria glabrata]XP_055885056.1 multiple epidermal growth factor-like domains protein 10 isoform X2 [Biomphalaria glabrata]